MKFLILLILIPFLALAESGVTNSFKIAGNSTTSKNLVNGSFESGANTGWTVGAGTLTATTAQAIQGVDSGLWTITGAGTIDLCATPTGLASTDLLASGWVKSTSTDLQVCSVVNSVENGCTPLGTVTGWKKVTASATYVSGNFCFRLKSVASGAITAYVDDVKLEPLENQQVSTVEQESITHTGYISKNANNNILLKTKDPLSNGSQYVITDTTATTYTKYKILKQCKVVVSGSIDYPGGTGGTVSISHFNSSDVLLKASVSRTDYYKSASLVSTASVGDYFVLYHDIVTPLDSVSTNFSITATAVRDNVIASWQAPSDIGEIKYLPQNIAPSGFIPANGVTIGYTSGSYQGAAYFDLYKVLWNIATTTSTDAYYISSAKGSSADADWAANKTIKIDESGLFTRAYLSGTSGAVGAKQLDAFQGHRHGIMYTNTAGAATTTFSRGNAESTNVYQTGDSIFLTDGVSGTPRTSSETRPTNVAKYAFIRYATAQPTLLALPTRSEIFSANVSIAGAVTNATQNFVTSCTNAAPSVCTLWSNFGVTPICWSTPIDITKRAEVTTTSTTSLTVGRTDTSTAFNLFCHLK